MLALLALLPCAVVLAAVLVLRANTLAAAAYALFSALAIWRAGLYAPATMAQIVHATADALVLELLLGLVIFCGLLFVEAIGRAGSLLNIRELIDALDLPKPRAVIFVTTGIGITLESLTGYGVSMLVTVPLLLGLVPRRNAFVLALVGMSLMSWGALSVAALLGAELAGVSQPELAGAIVMTSGPVAALLPFACLIATPGARPSDALFAFFASAGLCAGIWATSRWIGVELAGVGGGIAVIALTIGLAKRSGGLARPAFVSTLKPFVILIAVVVAQQLLVPHLARMGVSVQISTPRVTFDVLDSPSLALFAAFLATIGRSGLASIGEALMSAIRRSWRALVSVLLFLVTARLLVEIGGIGALSQRMAEFGETTSAIATVLLGALGAYATGSGVTSSALFMVSAVEIGRSFDALLLFAALQHSGSSHAAMASLPIIALLIAALPRVEPDDTRNAMRTGLLLAGLWTLVVITVGLVLLHARI